MKIKQVSLILIITFSLCSCVKVSDTRKPVGVSKMINETLPTIGIVIFDDFLGNEMMAPMDVFSRKDKSGKQLFNVVLISNDLNPVTSHEGINVLPQFTFDNCPKLNVLVVPSSANPSRQVKDEKLINFVKRQNETVEHMASHCSGAFVLGEAGVAENKNIVTYCGGGEQLQKDYPKLKVLDDKDFKVVKDGKLISSNGNLVSYLASLDLLEELTSKEQRKRVEDLLLINKLNSLNK